MWSKIKSFFRSLFSRAKAVAIDNDFLDACAELAKSVIERQLNIDLNGDGRIAAREEILASAQSLGLGRLRKIVDGWDWINVDAGEIARVLAIARVGMAIAAHFGVKVPMRYSMLESIVGGVFFALTEE
jgi:hypothetical protein